ncbi:oligoendopeptidase, M3 family [Leadbetterella byssophila DSM 17132]|uniref:Oligoendopeptidase, M3 family n=1 Tax=Leadbetterella byssophila (strain DSM 17132 / JCM 16389 / KACC 11308 / NBRC 106382 / 4M15) TaxID=649349 RepID=E4RUG1_LEAB4|nr:M3 family oligoendopeptidase [Leadbetterella byssophila]ADQ17852.1 oligoendopeptidase, M3 family [Leadbetterella byssophila DSM 17132]
MSKLAFEKKKRSFLPQDYQITSWDELSKYFEDLKQREPSDADSFLQWLKDKSELESVVSEDFAWRYIKMTCQTDDAGLQKKYQDFVENIQPHLAAYGDILNQKTLELANTFEINEPGYTLMIRGIEEAVKIFRQENISLFTDIQMKQVEYQTITGGMTVHIDDKELTMPQAGGYLQSPDRPLRERVWRAISERRLQDHETLDKLFSDLLGLRHQVARNAGFSNFRDYMFSAMGRFDYSPQDCFDFHEAIAETVIPVVDTLEQERKEKLGDYKPWDAKADVDGKAPLKPFENAEDLLNKTEICFRQIHPDFTSYIQTMRSLGHFDVESRKGKAPGGYNYPLEETGVPFIFMNATDTLRDLVTMVHEGGHAIHSFQVRDLSLNAYRNPPMEVAELASMSMELISMEHWDVFFPNEEDLKRAKREHLRDVLGALPWIATVDQFQHWLYENPSHSLEDRADKWVEIFNRFQDSVTDWRGLEKYQRYSWQKQLHIYEVPFYYIEYGMAQLGAISVWRNYKKDPKKGLEQYRACLSLGYTKDIKSLYAAAGIRFDFSKEYIADLMEFVKSEL